MKNYLSLLLTKFKSWKEAKVQESKQPLSRENAYVLSSIGKKKGSYNDVYQEYLDRILKDINLYAKMGEMYLLKIYPDYLSKQDKLTIQDNLITLGYSVCFYNNDVVLISWKYSKVDFNDINKTYIE